jgi:hypothetical protein
MLCVGWSVWVHGSFLRLLGAFAKLLKVTISFVISVHLSVCPHGTTQLPLDRFSWNLIFEYFFKKYQGNSSFFKTGQENQVLHMKTTRHFWSYLSQFFLEWEMFRTEFIEEIRTHILCSITFFKKSCRFWDNVVNAVVQGRPQMTIWCMRIACWMSKATHMLTICNTYCFSTAKWVQECASVLRHMYIACLLICISVQVLFLSRLVNI